MYIVLQVLILVAAALITTVTNKLLYYFALYTNHLERYALCILVLRLLLLWPTHTLVMLASDGPCSMHKLCRTA